MDSLLKNSLLNTVLSWLNHLACKDINVSYKEANDTQKLILGIDKFYKKQKPLKVPLQIANELTVILKEIQELFENEITFLDDNGNKIINDNGDIITINYSPMYLSLSVLDRLILDGDTSLRTKFGHIKTSDILLEIEEKDKELHLSTMRILDKIYRKIGV